MSSIVGEKLKVSLFGQSHSEYIGVVIDGFPSGFEIDFDKLSAFMSRRKATGELSTKRHEPDTPQFISGVVDSISSGAPICAIIPNTNIRSQDYKNFRTIPRPSHADYTALSRWGDATDLRGGGHLSGRITAALCIAGGLCVQFLESKGINIGAHILSIGTATDESFDLASVNKETLKQISRDFPVLNTKSGEKMKDIILEAKNDLDSVGGVVEFAAVGVPPGLGSPHFGGIENKISCVVFGVPALKGIEFGNGFLASTKLGSQNNDSFCFDEHGNVKTVTNNSGGINGGISNGMPIVGRVAIKPTSSISKEQDSINLETKLPTKLKIIGRHDPCVVHRAVVCIESAIAIALSDILITEQ